MQATDFIVARNDLQQCKSIETQLPDAAGLPDDALRVKVTRFGFTANNVTYAVMGDALKYWQLFPAPKDFGNIPVWALAKWSPRSIQASPQAKPCSAIFRWRPIS